jgi:hypothetical protein
MAWTRTSLRFAYFAFFNSPLSAGVVGVFLYISSKFICCWFPSRRFSVICLKIVPVWSRLHIHLRSPRTGAHYRSELRKLVLLSESGYATLLLDENRL